VAFIGILLEFELLVKEESKEWELKSGTGAGAQFSKMSFIARCSNRTYLKSTRRSLLFTDC